MEDRINVWYTAKGSVQCSLIWLTLLSLYQSLKSFHIKIHRVILILLVKQSCPICSMQQVQAKPVACQGFLKVILDVKL